MNANGHTNKENNIEERLWSFIDGQSSPEETSRISQLLASDAAWKAKYAELLELNKLLAGAELEAPSMRFTRNVMEEIGRTMVTPAARKYINNRIIWGIGIFFITLVVAFLAYGFSQVDLSSSPDTTIGNKISHIELGNFFNNTWLNAFLLINTVLGLYLLDYWLSQKRKSFREQS